MSRFSLDDEQAAEPLLQTEFPEINPEISPDGRWLAYVSNESGQQEVYVRPFPNIEAGKWQVSQDGGRLPVWAPDGRELSYRGLSRLRDDGDSCRDRTDLPAWEPRAAL